MWQLALQQAVYNCPNHFRLIYQAEAYRSAKWSWKPKRATRGLDRGGEEDRTTICRRGAVARL